jgi:hypothetical protein
MKIKLKKGLCKVGTKGFSKLCAAFLFVLGSSTPAMAQKMDEKLFMQFENHFSLLDSLIFMQHPLHSNSSILKMTAAPEHDVHDAVDSLIFDKVEKQMDALVAETGLQISGQTYYRLDEGFGIDDDDALSRYTAKMQVELPWNFLSSSLTDQYVVLAADVTNNRLVKLIAGDLDRFGNDNAVQRNNRNIGSTAADINDHMTVGHRDIDSCAQGCRNRLFDQIRAFGAGLYGRIPYGTGFHLRDTAGNADGYARLEYQRGTAYTADKMLKHSKRYFILADYAVSQRTNRCNITGCTAEHFLGSTTDFQNFICISINGNNGRLFQDDAFAFYVDKNRCGTKIDSYIFSHSIQPFPPIICITGNSLLGKTLLFNIYYIG